jgi:hypothetical protein
MQISKAAERKANDEWLGFFHFLIRVIRAIPGQSFPGQGLP